MDSQPPTAQSGNANHLARLHARFSILEAGVKHAAKRMATVLLTVVTVTGLSVAPANAGSATPQSRAQILAQLERQASNMQELQQQIELQLKLAPGGKQISANEVSYGNGAFVVTYAMPNAAPITIAASDCTGGWFCFYDNPFWGYPRGRLSDCGWQDLAWWGWHDRTESTGNATGSYISYIEHQDFGNPANGHSADYTLFTNDPWWDYSVVIANRADHVYRHC